jgi:hypothetical protein
VRLAQHDFWSHVARSSTCIKRVVCGHLSRNTEVSQSQVAFVVKHHILWFDVSMNDHVVVQESNSVKNLHRYVSKYKMNRKKTLQKKNCLQMLGAADLHG